MQERQTVASPEPEACRVRPERVGDALRAEYDDPGTVADALGPHAARFGLRRGDGLALLHWLLELIGDPSSELWMSEARAHLATGTGSERAPALAGEGAPR